MGLPVGIDDLPAWRCLDDMAASGCAREKILDALPRPNKTCLNQPNADVCEVRRGSRVEAAEAQVRGNAALLQRGPLAFDCVWSCVRTKV